VTVVQWFCLSAKLSTTWAALLQSPVTISFAGGYEKLLREPKKPMVNSTHAAAGASEPTIQAAPGATRDVPNSRRLSRADGRRGRKERNCVSSEFVSFIICSFQL